MSEKHVHELNPVSAPTVSDSLLLSSSSLGERRLPTGFYQKALQVYTEPQGGTPRFNDEVYHKNVVYDGLEDNQPLGDNFNLSLRKGNIQFLQLPDSESMILNFIDLRVGHYKIIVKNHSSSSCTLNFDPSIRVFEIGEQPAGADDYFLLDVVSDGTEVFVTLMPGPYRPI